LKYEFSFSTEARFCQTAIRAKRKRRGIINEHQDASKKWLTLNRNGWLAFTGICNHVHILLKSNTNLVDVKQILGNKWLLGFSKTTRIKTEEDKIKILNYITKELKPSSKRISDINKIDSWLFLGNWEINKDNEQPISKKKPITSTESKYKYTNDNELFNAVPLTGLVNKSSKREVSNRRVTLISS
jgi:hypothetical protein